MWKLLLHVWDLLVIFGGRNQILSECKEPDFNLRSCMEAKLWVKVTFISRAYLKNKVQNNKQQTTKQTMN